MTKLQKNVRPTPTSTSEPARPLIQAFSPPPIKGIEVIDTEPALLADTEGTLLSDIVTLLSKGDHRAAIDQVITRVQQNPRNAALANLLAALYLQSDQGDKAERTLMTATRLAPKDQRIINNIACAHLMRRSYTSAATLLNAGLRHGTPAWPEYFFNLALAHYAQNKFRDAGDYLQMAQSIAPLAASFALQCQLALIRDDVPQAMQHIRNGQAIFPHDALLHYYHSECLILQDNFPEAMNEAACAVIKDSKSAHFAILYGLIVRFFTFSSYNPNHAQAIETCLKNPHVSPTNFSQPWACLLRAAPSWQGFFGNRVIAYTDDQALAHLKTLRTNGQINWPFLLIGLRRIIIRDAKLEQLFTGLRRQYLLSYLSGQQMTDADHDFLAALAQQCFFNEYIYHVTEEEQAALAQIQARLHSTDCTLTDILISNCYQQLGAFSSCGTFIKFQDNSHIAPLIDSQITAREIERQLMPTIPTLTPIDDAISQAVEQMYMENPYPAWLGADYARDSKYLMISPHKKDRVQLLVAGCGTGHHAINSAISHQNLHVTAIDLSKRSLAYAKRKTQELGLTHIDYAQADILGLDKVFDQEFDAIECAGVLHHMRDPLAGLKILLKLLKPRGLLMLGLYSEYARAAMIAGRNAVAQAGYPATPEGIRAFRHDVLIGPDDLPTKFLQTRGDFFTISTCRDLVFHVQEHRYTLPQIKQILADHGLELVRMEVDSLVTREFRKIYPEETDLCNLDKWDAFEQKNPTTFSNMYQFWCRKIG